MEMFELVAYPTVVYFTGQNYIPKTVHCIWCVMICKIGSTELKRKNRIFCVRPWSLLTTLNFSERGLIEATVF